MERADFRVLALPVVASFYTAKAKAKGGNSGVLTADDGTVTLEKDSAALRALKRLCADVYGGTSNGKAEPAKAVHLSAGERGLAEQLSAVEPARLKAILARAKELRAVAA